MATNVSTINHSGEDYSTIALWESATDTDLVTAGNIEALEVYADDGSISQGAITFAGATTNSSNYRVLRAKSGDEWAGDLTPTSVATIAVTATNALKLNENYFRIEDIFFDTPVTSSRFPVQINNDYCLVRNCFFDDGSGPNVAGDNNNVTRCVMLNTEDTIDITGSGNTLSNCTMYGGTYGVYVTAANTTVYNNISDGHSYHDSYLDGSGSWHSNSAGNMSGGEDFGGPMPGLDNVGLTANTSPGAGNWMIVTNITSGSEDFQLVDDADNDAIGYGTTLTALESTDAFGNSANTNWDVGAFNLASASTEYTKTVTANAYVKKLDITKTSSANAYVKKLDITKTTSADGLLQSVDNALTASADGVVVAHKTLNVSHNGILKALDTLLTTSADGYLTGLAQTFTLTTSADAVLKALDRTKTMVANAILVDPSTALYTATARSALNTSTGTQQITTANFGSYTPSAAIQITTAATSNDTEANHAALSIGFTDGTDSVCVAFSSEHNQATTDTSRGLTADFIRLNLPGTANPDMVAAFSSWVTDGIVINISNAPAAAYLSHLILFGGGGVQAKAGVIVTTTPNSEQNINTVGFEPDVVLFIDADRDINQQVSDNYGAFGVAVNAAGVEQRSVVFEDDEGDSATNTRGEYLNSYALGKVANYRIEVGNFDAAGFSIWTRNTGANSIGYLALKLTGNALSLSTLATQPTTGDQELDVDVAPDLVIAGLSMSDTQNTTNTVSNVFPVGLWMADGVDEFTAWMRSQDTADPTDAASFSGDSLVVPDDAGSAAFAASLKSFDSDGFTLTWTAVDATPRYWWCLAIGDDAATSNTKGCTANAYLSKESSLTVSAGGWLAAVDVALTTAADGLMRSTHALTVSGNGIVTSDDTVLTLTADAYLRQSKALTTLSDALVQLDANLLRFYADATVTLASVKTVSADGYVIRAKQLQADSFLRFADKTVSCSADGFILKEPGKWDTVAPPEVPNWTVLKNER